MSSFAAFLFRGGNKIGKDTNCILLQPDVHVTIHPDNAGGGKRKLESASASPQQPCPIHYHNDPSQVEHVEEKLVSHFISLTFPRSNTGDPGRPSSTPKRPRSSLPPICTSCVPEIGRVQPGASFWPGGWKSWW